MRKVNSSHCLKANPLVVKTIRLREDKMREWNNGTRPLNWLKVVHLVRDPRARFHSLSSQLIGRRSFHDVIAVFGNTCRWEVEDLRAREFIPAEK